MASAAVAVQTARQAIRWEEPNCLLCNSARRATTLEAQDIHGDGLWFAVVRCADCGLQYTCPRPDESTIGNFYPADYGPHRSKPVKHTNKSAPLAWLRGRPCAERRALPWHGQGRLLDFGCGGGSFLERMRDQGWNVTGMDISADTAGRVSARLGVPVHVGTLPHPKLSPESFDVVTMWHVLEHVHRPVEVLREARRLLTPSGRLYVAVPNIASWPYQWFGKSWFGLELPRHLTHFAPDTLTATLSAAGFHGVRVRCIRHSDWLRSSARAAAHRQDATVFQRLLTKKPVARFAAWCCYLAGQSDCILATANI